MNPKHFRYWKPGGALAGALCGAFSPALEHDPRKVGCLGCRALLTVLLGRDPKTPRSTLAEAMS